MGKGKLLKGMGKYKLIYLLTVPGALFYIIFAYSPMYGIQLAFKEYVANLGIIGSPWTGLDNFRYVAVDEGFLLSLKNTLIISFMRICLDFPIPIIMAIFFNELRSKKYKSILQTVYTFPHFLSWVIVSGIMINLLGNSGVVNNILNVMGFPKANLLMNKSIFRYLLVYSASWKESGWSMIIYLAAISGIDSTLYEAATVDGANRFHKMIHITWPGIREMVIVMLILAVGNAMNAGFDQILNMYNPAVYSASDILDTYIYRMTFEKGMPFEVSTVIGLFKGITNSVLLLGANYFAKLLGGRGLV